MDPNGVIGLHIPTPVRIPSTRDTRIEDALTTFGVPGYAAVTDAPVDANGVGRFARQILFRDGWPIKDRASTGSVRGTVCEWRWLEREVAGEEPLPEAVALYDDVINRKGFTEFIASYAPKAKAVA